MKRVWLGAGEASGDALAASLVSACQTQNLDVEFSGICGPQMRSLGVKEVLCMEDFQVVGFTPALLGMPRFVRYLRRAERFLADWKPDLVIGVDNPGFNLRLAKRVRGFAPVIHCGAPQVWAWRSGRRWRLHKQIDELWCLFEFEKRWFAPAVPMAVIGHPAVYLPEQRSTQRPHFLLCPGSRPSELARLWPTFVEVVREVRRRHQAEFSCLVSDTTDASTLTGIPRLRLVRSLQALAPVRAALVCSGTVTLQVALRGIPQIIVARLDEGSYQLARRLVKQPYVGLPNILLNRSVVEERIQRLNPTELAQMLWTCDTTVSAALRDVLPSNPVERMIDRLKLRLNCGH